MDLDAIDAAARQFSNLELHGGDHHAFILASWGDKAAEIVDGLPLFPEEVEQLFLMLTSVTPLLTALRAARSEVASLRSALAGQMWFHCADEVDACTGVSDDCTPEDAAPICVAWRALGLGNHWPGHRAAEKQLMFDTALAGSSSKEKG